MRTLVALMFVFGCGYPQPAPFGGGDAASGDGGHGDAPGSGSGDASTMKTIAAVVAGNYTAGTSGVFSTVDPVALTVQTNAVQGVADDDPYLRLLAGKLYLVNRSDGENITVLDATTLGFLGEFAIGTNQNAQDVAVSNDKMYVPALNTAGVVVVQSGSAAKTIDLSSLDTDGKPDCVTDFAIGGHVYVACDLLDATFTPRGPGKLAVIDPTTDAIEPALTVTLPFTNPQAMIVQSPADSVFGGDLLIPLVGNFTDLATGCLARVTPGATPAANGCAIQNTALGGYVTHADIQVLADGSETLWLAVQSPTSNTGVLRSYDLKAGVLAAAPTSKAGQNISDVAGCPNGDVVAADETSGAAGLRVYKNGVEQTTTPLSLGITPGFGNNMVCYTQ